MEVVIVEYYGNFNVQSIFLTQESSVRLTKAVFWDNSSLMPFPVPSHVNTFFLIKTDQQPTGIFLTLAYLNNLSFSAVSELLTFTINSQINLEMIVSSQLNDLVATGDQTNFLE